MTSRAHIAEVLREGEALTLTVNGECMMPTLGPGSCITAQKANRYLPGDVLVFTTSHDSMLVHRLLGTLPGERLLCKADREPRPDALLPITRVVGRVIEIEGQPLRTQATKRLTCCLAFAWHLTRLATAKLVTRKTV